MIDRSPERVGETLANVDRLIENRLASLETLQELKTSLRIAQVWPEAWVARRKVRVIDYFDHNMIHPIGNRRPPTPELSDRLYLRIRRSKMIVGKLTDGERDRELTKLELAYIRGYLDTLETEL